SHAREGLRAEAAEGLARHPTPASLRVLDKLAREDRSVEVRKSAIEALGQVDDPEAASVLFQIARTHDDDVDVRREAVEALGQAPTDASIQQIQTLAEGAQTLVAHAEVLGQANKTLKHSCESMEQCKQKCKEKAESAKLENQIERAVESTVTTTVENTV